MMSNVHAGTKHCQPVVREDTTSRHLAFLLSLEHMLLRRLQRTTNSSNSTTEATESRERAVVSTASEFLKTYC